MLEGERARHARSEGAWKEQEQISGTAEREHKTGEEKRAGSQQGNAPRDIFGIIELLSQFINFRRNGFTLRTPVRHTFDHEERFAILRLLEGIVEFFTVGDGAVGHNDGCLGWPRGTRRERFVETKTSTT